MKLEEAKFITWSSPSKRESGSREHKESSKIISLDFKQHMGKMIPQTTLLCWFWFLINQGFPVLVSHFPDTKKLQIAKVFK